jgi:hypothetical protein
MAKNRERQKRLAKKREKRAKKRASRVADYRRRARAGEDLVFMPPKISAQLLDFAEPLLPEIVEGVVADDVRAALTAAAVVWNLVGMADELGPADPAVARIRNDVLGALQESLGGTCEETEAFLASMETRKRDQFPDPRRIVHFDVYDTPRGISVDAAATF